MDNILQTALAEAVNSLASFFGTTTEAIMEHAPEFLAKYGWYSTLSGLPGDLFVTILLVALICLIIYLPYTMLDIKIKHTTLMIFIIFIVSLMCVAGTRILTCVVAPEIVGVHAILELLKNAK